MKKKKAVKICLVEGCASRQYCRKLCVKHYGTLRRMGSVELSKSETMTLDLPPCSYPDCPRQAPTMGLCPRHYHRKYRTGSVELSPRAKVDDDPDSRFWAKVEKTEDCWLWNGFIDDFGKGKFVYGGKLRTAHGYAYQQFHGVELTRRDLLRHTCGVGSCVRPDHLRLSKEIIAERRQGN